MKSVNPFTKLFTKFSEDGLQFLTVNIFTKVLNVHIGELHGFSPQLCLTLLTRFKMTHKSVNDIKRHKENWLKGTPLKGI